MAREVREIDPDDPEEVQESIRESNKLRQAQDTIKESKRISRLGFK